MSALPDSAVEQDEVVTTPRPTRARVKAKPSLRRKFHVAMQWLHRWATFILGILLLVTTISGAIALYEFDLNRLSHPALYHATPSATLLSLDAIHEAFVAGIATEPALQNAYFADMIADDTDAYHVYLFDKDDDTYYGQAFVDPGTGKYLGYYNDEHTIWGWFADLHYSLFADTILFTYPEWVPEWLSTLIGASLADFLLKLSALSLLILVITGAYLWWPGIKRFATGFRIRPNAKGFVWHYDWHKVIGVISLPFLLMWAVTGLNFYSPFAEGISAIWHTVTFSTAPVEEEEELHSTPADGPMITAELAKELALAAAPGAQFISIDMAEDISDTVNVWLSQGIDPYEYGEFPGQVYVQLDAYSGEVLYNGVDEADNFWHYLYEWWFYPIHAGVSVSWPVRLIWLFFGLTPAFLAFTGVMQWWLRRQKRLALHARQQPVRDLPASPTAPAGVTPSAVLSETIGETNPPHTSVI